VRSGVDRARRGSATLALAALAALVGAVTLATAGCAGFTSDPALTLGLVNDTDRPVLVYVNDEWVGTFPVDADRDDITTSAHGGPPWRVEVRTDAGTVLAAFEADTATLPTGIEAETTCGDLAAWAGDARPPELEIAPGTVPCE
jgi:hypothetical protein